MIDFKGHRVEKNIILTCVRWYLAYPLSYRNLEVARILRIPKSYAARRCRAKQCW